MIRFFYIAAILFSLLSQISPAQSNPVALSPGITITRLMTVRNYAMRIVRDPLSGSVFYNTGDGNIYKVVIPVSGKAFDSLVYSIPDYNIDYAQDFIFRDSTLYILGNNTPDDSLTTGIVRKGVLQPNGIRNWSTVMLTAPHATCGYFDHHFSGMVLSPAGDSITINSGSRGDHGEIQTRGGMYPNLRNVPLTSKLFRIPAGGYTFLQNDSAWLAKSGFVFATGTRNNYSMGYDAKGNLFGLENSSDRDHNDEMNWLRRGRNYGFPYYMGDTRNPQQYCPYNCTADKLVNHYSDGWRKGTFRNDPTFPQKPAILFEQPIQNIGPDCDKFRDTVTARVLDASDLGITIGTFTAHRSPLGLVFDNDSMLAPGFRGDAFMLSWTKGCDSSGGYATPYDTAIGPFADPGQDLTHLHLMYNAGSDSYTLSATRIVADFANPVAAFLLRNKLFVLEWSYQGTGGLYEIDLPVFTSGIAEQQNITRISCHPNPTDQIATISCFCSSNQTVLLNIFDTSLGACVCKKVYSVNQGENQFTISVADIPGGMYLYEICCGKDVSWGKLAVVK